MDSLLCTQQNIYRNIDLLKNLWNYLSNEWSLALNGVQTRELWPFYFSAACCPENFRVHDFRCFGHNFLWETSIDFILDSLELELRGAFEYPKIYCNFLLRSSRILMITISSCEFIRRCQWSRSCGLWSIVSCVPRLQGYHHWLLANIAASIMCLLHCSCFTQGVGIRRCSCASCWWSERFPSLIASLD